MPTRVVRAHPALALGPLLRLPQFLLRLGLRIRLVRHPHLARRLLAHPALALGPLLRLPRFLLRLGLRIRLVRHPHLARRLQAHPALALYPRFRPLLRIPHPLHRLVQRHPMKVDNPLPP